MRLPIVALAVLAALAPPARAGIAMKITSETIGDPQQDFARKFAETVTRRTGGDITATVDTYTAHGRVPSAIAALQAGAHAGHVSMPGFLVGLHPGFQAPDAPGLYHGFWHAQNGFTDPAFRDRFLRLAEDRGIIGAAIFNYGANVIAAIAPVHMLAELTAKGDVIGVLASPMDIRVAEALGLQGAAVPLNEIQEALYRRVVVAARGPLALLAERKLRPYAPTLFMTNDGAVPSVLFLSVRWLSRVPERLRRLLFETARGLEGWAAKNALAHAARAEAAWRAGGGTIVRLSDAERAAYDRRLGTLAADPFADDPAAAAMHALLRKALAESPVGRPAR